MDIKTEKNQSRVRENSSDQHNKAIDEEIKACMEEYKDSTFGEINHRLKILNSEWGIERMLQVNASVIALLGLTLGTFLNKRWYGLSGVVAGFLLQHGLQGWCPPLPLFRSLGYRTQKEITEERIGLKFLRGDFKKQSTNTEPEQILEALRK